MAKRVRPCNFTFPKQVTQNYFDATPINLASLNIDPRVLQAETLRSPLARLPLRSILRSLCLGAFFTSPSLFRPGFAVFSKIATSQSPWLNPDRNPVLRTFIRPMIYDQFCAGRNEAEIQKTSSNIKQLGFSGIVLCYGKEVQLDGESKLYGYMGDGTTEAEVKQWKDGNLQTLNMIRQGDWLGMKLTGAGTGVTEALLKGDAPPPSFRQAIEEICERAASRGCRIWIDAEQQALQCTIDAWTYGLMRQFNRGRTLVYTTVQAYLKDSRDKLQHQLRLSSDEGWRLGVKLVRGAYISNDIRDRIHDTKEDTDASYNGIVEDLLRGRGFSAFESNPGLQFDLLLAGHNTHSIRRATQLASELAATSSLKVVPEFAQLQGMADDIGCELLQTGEAAAAATAGKHTDGHRTFVPKVYKCLTWGTVQECMQYLLRRLVENRGAADRMRQGSAQLRKELWRRVFRVA